LPHLGRFIKAAIQRLEKLPANPQRDRLHAAEVRRQWQRYQAVVKQTPQTPALLEARWMIEELRVSLFAQELGTSLKVSPERLNRLWQEIG
jgi:ATP-dependent helicase HrpA